MNRFILPALAQIFLCCLVHAQTGNLQIIFTPKKGGSPLKMQFAAPFLKFNNPHGFWFVNPHNGDRHLQYMPDQGWGDRKIDVAYITINENKNDYDFYDGGGNDSNQVNIRNNTYLVSAPENNRWDEEKVKPMHIHINNFTASECSFTFSGGARMMNVNSSTWIPGSIEGSVHFYREPAYEKSDVLPGCNCDPTIYAAFYDAENNIRTTSACENALSNKVFDAVQKAMSPLFSKVAYKGTDKAAPGSINIMMMPGHTNIDIPVKDRPYCSGDYHHNTLTGADAHKKYFNKEDAYGLRFVKIPTEQVLGGGSADPGFQKKHGEFLQEKLKLVAAGKMTSEQFTQADKDFNRQNGVVEIDIKKEEIQHNLTVQVMLNPTDHEMMLVKLGDKNNTKVQHTIRGVDYEIFTGMAKESDGYWIPNRLNLYMGKFTKPVAGKSAGGWDAEWCDAVYPANGNKLSIYNIVVKLEGDKEMMDKAVANIDFDALLSLITKQ